MCKNRFFGLCAVFVGLAFCIVGTWFLLKPAEYRATSRIKIVPAVTPENPHFIESDVHEILSKAVLTNVIKELRLDARWGRRYADGRTPGMDETFKLLLSRISI